MEAQEGAEHNEHLLAAALDRGGWHDAGRACLDFSDCTTDRIRMAVKAKRGVREGAAAERALRRARLGSSATTSGSSKGSPASRSVSSPTDVWQARVGIDFGAKLLEDAEILGLNSKTDIVKAALELLHRQAGELRMARGVEDFYRGGAVPLPAGVVPLDESELDDDPDA